MMKRAMGFTLIELMVVLAIIAILGTIAYPSYDSYMKKSRRADAKIALTKLSDRQERYYVQNNTYTTNAANLNLGTGTSYLSDEGYYQVTIDTGTSSGWSATAVGQGPQATDNDTNSGDCIRMTLDSTGLKGAPNNANPDKCW